MDLYSKIVNRALLLQIGARVLMVIKQRTLRGEFLPGSTGTSQYSTTPMPMPFGALQKAVRSSGTIKDLIESGDARMFESKAGKVWIVLTGGYKKLRELAGRETDHVTLNWSGKMMRNLKIVSVDTRAGLVTLGFDDERAKELASYHNDLGAGKSRKTHKFLGLTIAEVSELGEWVKSIMVIPPMK